MVSTFEEVDGGRRRCLSSFSTSGIVEVDGSKGAATGAGEESADMESEESCEMSFGVEM